MPLLARLLDSAGRLRALADELTASGDDVLADAARRAADTLDRGPLPETPEPLGDASPPVPVD